MRRVPDVLVERGVLEHKGSHTAFIRSLLLVPLAVPVLSGIAGAQSTTNFDTLSTGTVVTTQYPGVTISGVGGSGNCTITAVSAGTGQVQTTSSGTRYPAGPVEGSSCPTLRMTFTNLQKAVSFKTGTHQSFVTPPSLFSDGRRVVITA